MTRRIIFALWLLPTLLFAKFYKGRELAHVMSPEGIAWLERDTREQEERLSLLVEALDLKPGQRVADLGAGSGVISRLMAPRVGPGGQIVAIEIQDAMIAKLQELKAREKLAQLVILRGTETDPKLTPNSVDLILMVDVYHEFQDPESMLRAMSRALKRGGRIAVVEYRAEDPKVPIDRTHKMSIKQIRREFQRPDLGLKVERIDARLPRQHLVFVRKTSDSVLK
jgi:SAM-dependent methyltransferase